jgi:hypothetical protein
VEKAVLPETFPFPSPVTAPAEPGPDFEGRVEHRYAENEGVRIHYAALGEGPLVVMLPGFPDGKVCCFGGDGRVWVAWSSSGGACQEAATTASNAFAESTESRYGGGNSRNSSAKSVASTGTTRSTPRQIHTAHTAPIRSFLVTPTSGSWSP